MKRPTRLEAAIAFVLPSVLWFCFCPAQAKVKATNFFSTPEASAKDVPTYTGKPRTPIPPDALAPDGEMPRQNDLTAIPSLTGPQRKAIGQLFQDCRSVTQPLSEETTALEARRKELKQKADNSKPAKWASAQLDKTSGSRTTPNTNLDLDKTAAAPPVSPTKTITSASGKKADPAELRKENFAALASHMSATDIDARLPVLKAQTKDEYNKLSQKIAAILTADQFGELDEMRHGTLIIASDSRTDAPPPPPKPPANKAKTDATQKAATARHQVHNSAYNRHELWQFLWGLR